MLQEAGRPAILGPVLLLVSYVLYRLLFAGPKLPKLPIVGARKGDWFPRLQASWRNVVDFKRAVVEAERAYPNQTTLVPVAGTGDVVLLPRSEIQFVVEQPDSVLDMHTQVVDSMQFRYTSANAEIIDNPIHHRVITTTLTNQIGNLVPEVAEETAYSIDDELGLDTEYHEVCVGTAMFRCIGSVTNRVIVGQPKCRDPELLRINGVYAKWVTVIGWALRNTWKPVRPLVAFFLTIPIHHYTRKWNNCLRDEIDSRADDYDARQRDPEAKALKSEPNDFLQWCLKQAKEIGDPYLWDYRTLGNRMLLVNFAALHTSSMALTNVILDLVSSKQEYIDELRREIETVLADYGGEWNKRALARMEKLDSLFRESARLNSFVTVGLNRRVMAKEGITTPSGIHIPCGATVGVPSYTVLFDDSVYPDAHEFKPFRFSVQREDDEVEYVKRANKSFATTGKDYLAFGHGRNACPGRFFAANELKLMLAYLIMNYDMEVTGPGTRPRNKWYGLTRIPSMEATVRMRRRART